MIGIQAATDPHARTQIAMDDAAIVRRWTRHFGITEDELRSAVEKVGPSVAAVRKHLHTK